MVSLCLLPLSHHATRLPHACALPPMSDAPVPHGVDAARLWRGHGPARVVGREVRELLAVRLEVQDAVGRVALALCAGRQGQRVQAGAARKRRYTRVWE